MIPYIIKAIKNPITKALAYYVQSAKQHALTRKQLEKRIERRSTVSSADVKAVLDALEFEIIDALQSGMTVPLGELGTFYTRLKSKPAETLQEAWRKGPELVEHVTCCFLRSRALSQALDVRNLEFGPDSAEQERKEAYRREHPEEFQD